MGSPDLAPYLSTIIAPPPPGLCEPHPVFDFPTPVAAARRCKTQSTSPMVSSTVFITRRKRSFGCELNLVKLMTTRLP
jgi:hypothetical protein